MKRSKLLIPTLTCLSIAPAIVSLSSCNQEDPAEKILNAILKPLGLEETTITEEFVDKYAALSNDEKKNELLYDTFGLLVNPMGDANEKLDIYDLYKNKHEGAWKINVTKYSVSVDGEDYYGTLLGYVTYVFSKQHVLKIGEDSYVFNANDYIMLTFDFSNIGIQLFSNCSIEMDADEGFALGFYKFKYESGKKEALKPVDTIDTANWTVKNSKRWVK